MNERDRTTQQGHLLALCQNYMREGDRLAFRRDEKDIEIRSEAGLLDETRRNDLYYALKYKLDPGDAIRLSMSDGQLLYEVLDVAEAAAIFGAAETTPASPFGEPSADIETPDATQASVSALVESTLPVSASSALSAHWLGSGVPVVVAPAHEADVIADWYNANPQEATREETTDADFLPFPSPPSAVASLREVREDSLDLIEEESVQVGIPVVVEQSPDPKRPPRPPVINRTEGGDALDADATTSTSFHNRLVAFSHDTRGLRNQVNVGVAVAMGLGCWWLLASGLLAELWGHTLNHMFVDSALAFWLSVCFFFLVWFTDLGQRKVTLKEEYLAFRSELMALGETRITADSIDANISLSEDSDVKTLGNNGKHLAPSELQRRLPEVYPEIFRVDVELGQITTEALSWFKWGFGLLGCMIAGRLADIRFLQISANSVAYAFVFFGFVFLGWILQRKVYVEPRAQKVYERHQGLLTRLPELAGLRPGALAALINDDPLLDSGLLQGYYEKQDPDFNKE